MDKPHISSVVCKFSKVCNISAHLCYVQVAVLCNHQRTVSAQDADKLQRLHAKRGDLQQHGQLLVHDLDIMSREEAGTRHYLDTPLR